MNPSLFCIAGVKVIKFGTIVNGTTVTLEKGLLGEKGEYQTFPSVDFFPDGRCAVGTAKGEVYIFRERTMSMLKPVGVEPVNALLALPNGLLAASGTTVVRLGPESQCIQAAKATVPLIESSVWRKCTKSICVWRFAVCGVWQSEMIPNLPVLSHKRRTRLASL